MVGWACPSFPPARARGMPLNQVNSWGRRSSSDKASWSSLGASTNTREASRPSVRAALVLGLLALWLGVWVLGSGRRGVTQDITGTHLHMKIRVGLER